MLTHRGALWIAGSPLPALKVLEMFRKEMSRKAFVDRLLQSNEVSKSSSLFPGARGGGMTYTWGSTFASPPSNENNVCMPL
jgi:hypothetical protein